MKREGFEADCPHCRTCRFGHGERFLWSCCTCIHSPRPISQEKDCYQMMEYPRQKDIVFVSGHIGLSCKEFADHYADRVAGAIEDGKCFVVGDAAGCDTMVQGMLSEICPKDRVTVYHMLDSPRNNAGGFRTVGGFKSDEERDAAMTSASTEDIAWVRPGKEMNGTARNLLRRREADAPERQSPLRGRQPSEAAVEAARRIWAAVGLEGKRFEGDHVDRATIADMVQAAMGAARPFVYLATPYSDPDPAVMTMRFKVAAAVSAEMMRAGVTVFCPIVHGHPMAEAGSLPRDWRFWEEYDRKCLSVSARLAVLRQEGWDRSEGVAREMRIAEETGMPIEYIDPPKAGRDEATAKTPATRVSLSQDEVRTVVDTLQAAADDIHELLRVADYNLNGTILGEKGIRPETPMLVHQRGMDESRRVVARCRNMASCLRHMGEAAAS